MQRMVMFRLNRECRDIAVNPARVLYVCHYEHGASSLHFGKECFVRVQGEMEEVVRKLEGAETAADLPCSTGAGSDETQRSGVN